MVDHTKTRELKFEEIENKMDTPVFPEKVFTLLPNILKERCEKYNDKREREMFLISSIMAISECLPNVYGIYDQRKVLSNLYAMIIAPPASGKGVVAGSIEYIQPLKDCFALQNEITSLEEGPKNSKFKPQKKRLVIPANSSSASFIKKLNAMGGSGIMFETEADSLSSTLKNDCGNYSDMMRKAFHHEPITSGRIDEEASVEIPHPQLSILITGTFDQVRSMKLHDPMNGLQSSIPLLSIRQNPSF